MKFLLLLMLALQALPGFACHEDGNGGFAPENGLWIPADGRKTGISEAQFERAIRSVEAVYRREARRRGGTLQVERRWEDGAANARALRSGRVWKALMYGGLARHPHITEDGFTLVVCHEVGHHLGGAPRYRQSRFNPLRWASDEGQADYFGVLKCLRRVWWHDDNGPTARTAPMRVREACSAAHRGDQREIDLCARSALAGLSVSRFLGRLGPVLPDFQTPSREVAPFTFHDHPAAQCRLDTYFQAALCEKSPFEDVSSVDEVRGTCHPSTGHSVGNRPRCWFKPRG